MISPLAKGDYDDMVADGLAPTLEDFDRLNQIALRLTSGGETTAANFPRIGWAGDIPFYQPTCAAFAWYLEFVERADFDPATKDTCWHFALANGRRAGAFDDLHTPAEIDRRVNRWLASLNVTREEIVRACRYAAVGFDDAVAAKNDAAKKADAKKTDEDRREESLEKLDENITVASALTGVSPRELATETPSRLKKMVDEVRANNPMGRAVADKMPRLRADYDLTYREIRLRLISEKTAKEAAQDGK